MKPYRMAALAAATALTIGVSSGPSAAFEPGVTTESTVENFVLTGLLVNCPPGPWGAAFQWDMNRNKPGYDDRIDQLLTAIDRKYGGWIRSKTTVRDGSVEQDKIVFKARGSHDKGPGKELCEYLAAKM